MMDYKYIEQLLERYWECETTIQEEQILHAFFSQDDIPESLAKFREAFAINNELAGKHLGEDFDARILSMTSDTGKHMDAKLITMHHRLRPLYRAAAMVAIVLTIGMAAQQSFVDDSQRPTQMWAGQTAEDPDSEYTQLPNDMENTSAKASGIEQDSLGSGSVK